LDDKSKQLYEYVIKSEIPYFKLNDECPPTENIVDNNHSISDDNKSNTKTVGKKNTNGNTNGNTKKKKNKYQKIII
jgi:hypothetical protein